VSSPEAGWYPDPETAGQLRYWDGSAWTDSRAPDHSSLSAPFVAGHVLADVYNESADLNRLLTPEQQEQYREHTLTRFPVWLVVVLHFLTLGLFTLIYQGLKLSKLPLVKESDFRAGKGIGFMFIPFFNLYWVFRYVLSITERLNFQFRLRGERPPISRALALTSAIVWIIPYVELVSLVLLMPIVAGQWQAATNRLADERARAAAEQSGGTSPTEPSGQLLLPPAPPD
jgi:hypothetical protein